MLFGIKLILIFIARTHTIISALMGFTLVENGSTGINLGNPNLFNGSGVFEVIYGLLVSPIFTLGLSFAFYYLLYRCAVEAEKPTKLGSKLFNNCLIFLFFLAITFTFFNMEKRTFW